ncbi:MAG: hypothetical protein M3Z25_15595 [Actinomycetota bacterium]|nr:hypothetical protein [Actinomycetota bacterium]
MGMLGAFLFGYWMGTRSGQEGMHKLRGATLTLVQSDEFKSGLAGVAGMARGALSQGMDMALSAQSSRAA